MNYASKYRPALFSDVIGQDSAISVLRASLSRGICKQAYFFSGPSGVGKTTIARILAKALLCEHLENGEPCNTCESCRLFINGNHYGYRELDAATCGGKEDMVKLRDEAFFAPVSKKKILLIDECHDISAQGQDALLKQVEESPDFLVYIFCTTEPNKVKKTLRKRCAQYQFSFITPQQILPRLQYICATENLTFEEEALQLIAEKSAGHVRDALNILEEISYLGTISCANLLSVYKDFDEHVFNMVQNIGVNIEQVIESCRELANHLSASDIYDLLLAAVSDGCKYIAGSGQYTSQRLARISRLKDIHGQSLFEFLGHLISKDRPQNIVSLQSDLLVLHYKFGSGFFTPKVSSQDIKVSPVPDEPQKSNDSSSLNYANLSKMSIKDRCKVLRDQRKNVRPLQEKKAEGVPVEWPLPKEEKLGESSSDDQMLSPKDFSQQLVGGRLIE